MENNNNHKKKIITSIIIVVLIISFFGVTFAYYEWKSTEAQKTEIAVTIDRDFMCTIDGGGPINSSNYQLIPIAESSCATSEYAIQREIKLITEFKSESNPVLFDVWLEVNKLDEQLSVNDYLKYAITTSNESCTEGVVASGTFNGKNYDPENPSQELKPKTDNILSKLYDDDTEDTYYLYIWLDINANNDTMNKSFNISLNGQCTNEGQEDEGEEHTISFDANGGVNSGTKEFVIAGQYEYKVPTTGNYKLEVWGAQGYSIESYIGGYGGYSTGTVSLNSGNTLYVNVGAEGAGDVLLTDDNVFVYMGSGGGSSHITTASGTLSSLSSNKSSILIVAGGGGSANKTYPHWQVNGGHGGGYVGNKGSNSGSGDGGTQTAGGTAGTSGSAGSFGTGATKNAGGGGGYYGGGSAWEGAGGGGSGYIGNTLLTDKVMYCYNCATSSDESTKTISTTNVSATAISNYAKKGDGFVKITFSDKFFVIGSKYGDLPTPTRENYTFVGWNTKSDGTGTYITSKTIVSSEVEKLYAIWNGVNVTFDANGGAWPETKEFITAGQFTYTVPTIGNYKLEVWGAQGYSVDSTYTGGYGGYSTGTISLDDGNTLYVNVGAQGTGSSIISGDVVVYLGKGGGSTHIATASGTLSSLSSNKSKILIVAGGGGSANSAHPHWKVDGGHAGGYKGNSGSNTSSGYGGRQYSGGAAGIGGSAGSFGTGATDEAGGGYGYYGGGSAWQGSGGGGSGYIGNTLLKDKVMYCYSCTESPYESIKTISTTNVSATAKSNYAKSGNGYAKITFINNKNFVIGSTYGELPTPTRDTYVFVGWNTKADGTGTYITNETIVSADIQQLYAIWKQTAVNVSFNANGGSLTQSYATSGAKQYTIPYSGKYKLEVWGAQGYSADSTYIGGYGGYSVGTITLNSGNTLYVNVGAQGTGDCENVGVVACWGQGGGATHIATASGTLSSLSSNKSSILIVAGGGGSANTAYPHWQVNGGHGGGYKGNSGSKTTTSGGGGTQTAGGTAGTSGSAGSFGAGATDEAGGGGGYYGGGSAWEGAGGGGSGYIGNSLLTDKVMYCYSCEESTNESIKTISTTNVSTTAVSNYAKSGDGTVKITLTGKSFYLNSKYGDLPTPTRTDYVFAGWNTKSDGTGTTITSSSIVNLSNNITLYAIWN